MSKSKKPLPVLINDVVLPKDNNSILTLADGKKIHLDKAVKAALATQEVNILKISMKN